jgi:hypothetical protein
MQRPTVVTVFGILNIGFAAIGLIGAAATLLMFRFLPTTGNPVLQLMNENALLKAWTDVSLVIGAVASVGLLAAGIGLLMMKNWARVLSLVYGVYAILSGVVGMVLTVVLLCKPLLDTAGKHHGPEIVAAIAGAIGGTVGGCISLIYPILLIIFMTRPRVVAAFKTPSLPPPLPRQ